MNQPTNPTMNYSGTNRLIAAPKSDAGRFVSDAGFRTDDYFCNRLNVAPVTTTPKGGCQKESVDSFSVDTDPRPWANRECKRLVSRRSRSLPPLRN